MVVPSADLTCRILLPFLYAAAARAVPAPVAHLWSLASRVSFLGRSRELEVVALSLAASGYC
jgi:hypothetical protein